MWGKTLSAAAVACQLAFGLAGTAEAMSVSPVQVEMTSAGSASRSQVTVRNSGTTPLPVETSLQALQLDAKGVRTLSPAGEDFLVFPPQAMIPAGGTQVFRLQWVGDPALAKSQSYMFTVSEVPVKFPKGQSKIQVVMGFGVVIDVAAAGVMPSLTVVSSKLAKDKQGNQRAVLIVENPTTTHALLPDGSISLSGEGWSKTLNSTQLRDTIGIGLVQPGMRRRFVLPVTVPASVTNLQVSLDYHPKH
jgi:fimbrial chaperone protein